MLRIVKMTTGVALLISLSACASVSSKQKAQLIPINNTIPTSDTLDARTEADYQYLRADVLSREGQFQQAIDLFEKVAILDPSVPVYLRLSAEYQKLSKIKEALVNAKKAVEKDPQHIEARFALADLSFKEKDYDQAKAQFKVILSLEPSNDDAIISLGSLYLDQKDFKRAEQSFKSLLNIPNYEDSYLAYYYLGVMHLESGKAGSESNAEKSLKNSLQLKPKFKDAVISLANLYMKQNKAGEALALCMDYQEKAGYRQSVSDLIIQIHMKNAEFEKAYKQYDFIASQVENTLDAEFKMALILIKAKKNEEAQAKLKDILVKYPDSDAARFYLAAVHEEIGDLDTAIQHYALVPASSQYFSDAVAHAGYLLKGKGQLNQALSLVEKAVSGQAEAKVYLLQASLLDSKSEHAAALRSLEKGIAKYSKNADLYFQHAVLLDRLGKKEAMVEQMKKVLELSPEHIQALSYLAFTWADKNQNLSEAAELARKASDLAPEDGFVLDTLGWVLFKQKNYAEAVEVLEKAFRYQPAASIIAEHLADAYAMQSQTEKAKDMYKKATGLATDEAQAGKIRSKLQQLST